MIEIKIVAEGRHTTAALAKFLPAFEEAKRADHAEWLESMNASETANRGNAAPQGTEETVARVVEEAAAAEEPAPKKRGRPKKEEAAPVEPEPVANISATPEDRQPPAEVEDAEVVEETAPASAEATEADVRNALADLVQKVSMPTAMEWLDATFGVGNKMSQVNAAVAEGKLTYGKIIAAIQLELAE